MKPGEAAPRRALRLLCVEDNRLNAMLLAELVRLHGGIEWQLAESGAEALALAPSWRPDVLVLDAHLPDIDGHCLLAHLRAVPALASTPAFMYSADSGAEAVERARRAGFAGHWSKPIDLLRVRADLDALASPPAASH